MADLEWSYTAADKDGVRWVEIIDLSAGKVVTSWPCKDSGAARCQAKQFFDDLSERLED